MRGNGERRRKKEKTFKAILKQFQLKLRKHEGVNKFLQSINLFILLLCLLLSLLWESYRSEAERSGETERQAA